MKEPKIVDVERGFDCAGLSARTSDKTVFRDLPVLYAKYMKLKEGGMLRNLREPWQYVSLSTAFSADASSWTYLTGHVVTKQADESEGVVSFSTPCSRCDAGARRCSASELACSSASFTRNGYPLHPMNFPGTNTSITTR